MTKHLTARSTLYWTVPLTILAATAYASTRARSVTVQPLKFVPSGEPIHDSEALEKVRQDWRERNKGIGLRDVSRSGGGV